jgi:hypothetical protein
LGQLRAARKNNNFEYFLATFEGGFFNFSWAKKNKIIFKDIAGSALKSCLT